MALPLPTSLSPSKISAFTDCALAFRFSAIDRLPEPPSLPASKGTLVHRALQLLFREPAAGRTLEAGLQALAVAWEELAPTADFTGLELDDEGVTALLTDADELVRNYFRLEDPASVHAIGLELMVEAQLEEGLLLRGIIDRLDRLPDGSLVVTDYKTGRAPDQRYEGKRLTGVHAYALLCERVLGVRPARVQLLHLAEPIALVAEPNDGAVSLLERKSVAIWRTIERACATDDFRPRPGRLCDWCSFQRFCPAFGGDPAEAQLVAAAGA